MPQLITLARLRAGVQETIEELVTWFVGKPRLFQLARPEQQIQFELATRVRERIRAEAANRSWDRLFFDATPFNVVDDGARRPPPIFVDTRQLFGVLNHKREPTAPDVAIAVHVLRGAPEQLSFDANGVPTGQPWVPVNMRAQGMWVEQRVAQFERLSHECCDGALLAIYANDTGRRTAVDARDIASWASWQKPVADVWWAVRHFRAKVPPR